MRFLVILLFLLGFSFHLNAQPFPPDNEFVAFEIDPNTIPESEYVVVKDGHLSINGHRQRYWAAVGKVYANANVKPEESDVQSVIKLSWHTNQPILYSTDYRKWDLIQ
ncbi:MAG: hypothetical protein HC830_10250 [Bacteroidetes bacterium]|nr:hypothetical protein [Bacteroidota bacterium]